MSRELKRVPLDFDWNIGETWLGYINPHKRHDCKDCEGLGWSKDFNKLQDEWYSWDKEVWKPNPYRIGARYNSNGLQYNLNQEDVNALLKEDRLWNFTRVAINDEQREIVKQDIANGGNGWLPFNNGYVPTADEVNQWNLKGMGHDSINCTIVIKARLEKEGKSHLCSTCDGTGEIWNSVQEKQLFENWERSEPPTGDGFQLWLDTYPMTPVFKSLEELCEHCESAKVSVFGRETASKEQWMNMLNDGFVYHKEGNNIFLS